MRPKQDQNHTQGTAGKVKEKGKKNPNSPQGRHKASKKAQVKRNDLYNWCRVGYGK